jgi:hypothetical protein
MLTYSKLVSVTVLTPDRRVLTYRKNKLSPWSTTFERRIGAMDNVLVEINRLFWNIFGINTNCYSDNYIELKQLTPMLFGTEGTIHPFIAEFNSAIVFSILANEECRALPMDTLIDEAIVSSIGVNSPNKYTTSAVRIISLLKSKGDYD